MLVALLIGACVFPDDDGVVIPLPSAAAGPSGADVPTNVMPWVMLPAHRVVAGPLAQVPRAASHRDVKLVDRRGREVPVRRVQEELSDGTWVRLEPRAPLPSGSEFRLMAPGAVMVSFTTGAGPDLAPPIGGALRSWTWEAPADPEACPTLTLRCALPVDPSGITWEVEMAPVGDPAALERVLGGLVPGRAGGAQGATVEAAQITLRDCVMGNASIPRAGVDLRLRWVDAAGNAAPWTALVRIPTAQPYAGETVPSAVSAW